MKQFAPSICKTAWSRVATLFFGIGILLLTYQQSVAQTTQPETLTNASIVKMATTYKFSAAIIKSKIESSYCKFNTSIDSLLALRSSGVPDEIIDKMVSKVPAKPTAPPSAFPRELWGKLSKDEKTYVYRDGSRALHVGDMITLDRTMNAFFCLVATHNTAIVAGNYNQEPVTDEYFDGSYKLEKIVEGRGETLDGPKVMYMYLLLKKILFVKTYAEIKIENVQPEPIAATR